MKAAFKDNGNGTATYLGYLTDGKNKFVSRDKNNPINTQKGQTVLLSDALKNGVVIEQNKNKSSNNNLLPNMKNKNAIGAVRTQDGYMLERAETQIIQNASQETLTIAVDYTNALAGDPDKAKMILIGDGSKILRRRLKLTAADLPASVIVTSPDFGEDALAAFEEISVASAILFEGATFRAIPVGTQTAVAAAAIFESQPIREVSVASPKASNISNTPIDFDIEYTGYQQDVTVRNMPSYIYKTGAYSALYLEIPKGFKFSVTLKMKSFGDAQLMRKV